MNTPPVPTILLVDDEEENIQVIENFLTNFPCKIYKAYDGRQALKIADIVNPDLILLDINMPEIDGIEVCRTLKKEEKFQGIPIIFVTAWGDVATHVEAIEAGGYSFVTKPVVREQLLAYVSQALQVKQTGDHAARTLDDTRSAMCILVHDLRNLIQINHGYLQLVIGATKLTGEPQEFIQVARQSTIEMQILVNAILDIEKKESTGLLITPSTVSLAQLVRQRTAYASVTGQGKQLRLALPPDDENTDIVTDRIILARVLDNLLLNALKFSPKHGLIEAALTRSEKGWHISIMNEGNAIPAEFHEKIFQKFSQLELRQKSGLRGVGLGLAFCKIAMESLHGSIRIESPIAGKKGGTAFHLDLPVSFAAAQAVAN